MDNKKNIRILIADDHGIVRRGLKEILNDEFPEADIREVNDGSELLSQARSVDFNIVISDLTMPGRNGLETLKQLKEEFPSLPVLIVSMHPEESYAIRVLKAGAAGYLTKDSASEDLVGAVKMVLNGRRYISSTVAEKLAQNLDSSHGKELHEFLSDREFDVLKLIAGGKTISEIATDLSLSITTVSTYRARILAKMNLRTNAELIHYGIQNNLV